jgi:non-ribosomal peptide synthetase component F
MTDAEEQRMRKLLSGERRERPSTTLAAMLERCADERPGALALWDDEESWTFGELDALSNGIARQLLEHGAGDNRVVAVFMPRSAATIACFLGVLKAGSAFVPIDSNAPPERVRQILDLASPHLLLVHPDMHVPGLQLPTLEADRARLDSWKTVERPPRSGSPESLAYVIFTSGSTGQPKGAMIEQRSLVNLIGSFDELIYAGEPRGLRVGLNAPF